jgi:peptide deformylase
MEKLEILTAFKPEEAERLRAVAQPVKTFNGDLKRLVLDMYHTMYEANGIGLAAPQIGLPIRLFILDLKPRGILTPITCVNPTVSFGRRSGMEWMDEGCLSIPGYRYRKARVKKLTVQAHDVDGTPFSFSAAGLLARAVAHEMDHLNGVLIGDHT